jgi:hypothetical protein
MLVMLSACASAPIVPGSGAEGVPLEVVGHVTRACAVSEPQPNVAVTLRAAGELDALGTTQTDANGAFRFSVVAPSKLSDRLLIEAQGARTRATQRFSADRTLVAEVRVPCQG